MARLNALSLVLVFVAGGAGCGDADSELEQTRSAIVGGVNATDARSPAIALLAGPDIVCSGTLVHPRLVLTAHHCLFPIKDFSVTDNAGDCVLGPTPIDIRQLSIHVGLDRNAPAQVIKGKTIIYDPNNTSCTHDLAFLELEEDANVPAVQALSLDSQPKVGDSLRVSGWGSTKSRQGGPFPPVRQDAEGTVVLVGAGTYIYEGRSVPSGAGFIVSSVIGCIGDSGSGFMDRTGALAAVAFGTRRPTDKTNFDCTAPTLAVPLALHAPLIEKAFQAVGKMPTRAGHTAPGPTGAVCAQDNECNSNLCVAVGTKKTCSQYCTEGSATACPSSMLCANVSGSGASALNVCVPTAAAPVNPSCASSRSTNEGGLLWAGVIAGIAGVCVRRRHLRRAK